MQRTAATVFHRFMQTGRTSPALLGCTDTKSDEDGDYVVKLKGGQDLGTAGLVCEAIAAELADYFELDHPPPAFVEIDEAFAELVAAQEPEKAVLIRKSIGMNLGTKVLNNLVTWPIDRGVSASQLAPAAEVFAFDALIQNPDRRFSNPNIGSVGERLFIFDHELAFSFRLDIFPQAEPWKISQQKFWNEHVFFHALRHRDLPLESFVKKLAVMPVELLEDLQRALPQDWDQSVLPVVKKHLNAVSTHADSFRDEIVRRLI